MAEAETQERTQQCKALTEDGERCSRPAQDDEFCYQHDESDPTVSDSQAAEQEQETEQEAQQADQEGQAEQEQSEQEQSEQEQSEQEEQETESREAEPHPRSGEMTAEEVTDPSEVDADVDVDVEREEVKGILAIRQSVKTTAGQLIGREFDAVSEIAPTDDGWRAVVEVVERRSVPDTQDVIGRYEIELDTDGTVHGYRRLDRYRRGDTASFE